jgi:hypothetical protein
MLDLLVCNSHDLSVIYLLKLISDDYHLPEDDNHHSHRRGNLKSYKVNICYPKI